jgi:hypothetical protein
MVWGLGVSVLACLSTLSSCGGGSGTCGGAAACGGNIVGTWRIVSTCGGSPMASVNNMPCPGASVSADNVSISGTITFNSDMSYSGNVSVSGSETAVFPPSCLTQGTTCADLNQIFSLDPSGSHCSSQGSSCACTIVAPRMPLTSGGTYMTTSAGLLTETPEGGAPQQSDYCVQGSTLTFSPHAGSTMMGMSSGTVTLTKQ